MCGIILDVTVRFSPETTGVTVTQIKVRKGRSTTLTDRLIKARILLKMARFRVRVESHIDAGTMNGRGAGNKRIMLPVDITTVETIDIHLYKYKEITLVRLSRSGPVERLFSARLRDKQLLQSPQRLDK